MLPFLFFCVDFNTGTSPQFNCYPVVMVYNLCGFEGLEERKGGNVGKGVGIACPKKGCFTFFGQVQVLQVAESILQFLQSVAYLTRPCQPRC